MHLCNAWLSQFRVQSAMFTLFLTFMKSSFADIPSQTETFTLRRLPGVIDCIGIHSILSYKGKTFPDQTSTIIIMTFKGVDNSDRI